MKNLELKIPPPIVTLISFGLIWGLVRVAPDLTFDFSGSRWLAIIFIVLGGCFGVLGILNFKKHKTTLNPSKPESSSTLVTTGIYQITRNPMYFGLLLGLLGVFFYYANFLGILGVIFFVTYLTRFQIRPEEQRLEAKFGQAYLDYKQKVRRWI